jgi:short-subunit dehydrogenase
MPASNEIRRWLITGCSSGLGKYLAEAALARGDRVILTARSVDALGDLAARRRRHVRGSWTSANPRTANA